MTPTPYTGMKRIGAPGFRDYGKKLPFTTKTTVPIASNTKLFTAVAAGLLVEDRKRSGTRMAGGDRRDGGVRPSEDPGA